MNQVRDFFRLASIPSLALAGAKAPKRWRRELRRLSQSHKGLERTWIWVTRLDELNVCLRDGPPWGNCLSDLLGSWAKSGGAPPDTMREAGQQPAGLERVNARNESVESTDRERRQRPWRPHSITSQIEHPQLPRRRLGQPGPTDSFLALKSSSGDATSTPRNRHPVGARSTGLPIMAVTALPFTVNHGQLTKALCQPDSISLWKVNDSGSPQSSRPQDKILSRRPDHPTPSDGTPIITQQDAGTRPALLAHQRRGQRIGAPAQRGKAEWKSEMTRRVGEVLSAVRWNSSTHDRPNSGALTQQWAVTLSGPTASPNLLTLFSRSAQPDGTLAGSYDSSQRLEGNNALARDSAAAQLLPEPNGAGHAPNRTNESNTSPTAAQPGLPPVDQSAPGFAVALPPLVVGAPTELGDAAVIAVARQGAEIEALSLDEDFDALADKIKLILDEQARRFGIDV